MKYHQDRLVHEKRKKREEVARLKRIASGIAKEIKAFWSQIEKVCFFRAAKYQSTKIFQNNPLSLWIIFLNSLFF